jgi:hypothetical protein
MAAVENELVIERDSVAWLTPDIHSVSRPRAVFVGRKSGGLRDIYTAELHVSPLGQVLSCALIDVSRTPELDESDLVAHDGTAAWLLHSSAGFTGARAARFVSAFDEKRISDAEPADWDLLERWQSRVQNLAEYGFLGLLVLDEIRFEAPARHASLSLAPSRSSATEDALELSVAADADAFAASLSSPRLPRDLDGRFAWIHPEIGRPGNLVTWSAERLRDTWLGDRGVALLKAVGFAGRDYAELAIQAAFPSDGSEQVESDLGSLLAHRATSGRGSAGHFPPAPLEPIFAKPLAGEGQWLSLDDDPFVRKGPDGRAPFSFTFLRPDPSRPFAQAYVVLWDPRRLELHLAGGTDEPRSARGEHGTGRIPRDPKVLSRLAGAFNGAFRTRHGEFGMGAEGTTYLPPRPYAATVATLDDGSTVFGTWPDSPAIPSNVTSFRQNMTALVQAGAPNPYHRHYWGGVPDGWVAESFTVRTALCLTKESFVAYIYGTALDPGTLMRAAAAARCDYAIHLDMNAGHTGFEFYRAAPADRLGDLGRALDEDWEARGNVDSASGARFDFLARRMTEHMPLMSFPRYIGREQRDFFYLTARPMVGELALPASWTTDAASNGWQWAEDTAYPPALAHASITPFPSRTDVRIRLLTLDPRLLRPRTAGEPSKDVAPSNTTELDVVDAGSERKETETSKRALWWTNGEFVIALDAPGAAAIRVSGLHELARGASGVAFVGTDENGFLVYGELEGGVLSLPGDELARVGQCLHLEELTLLGRRIAFRERVGAKPNQAHVSLVRSEGPSARRFFEETPVVPPRVWAIRQRAPIPTATSSTASRSVYLR